MARALDIYSAQQNNGGTHPEKIESCIKHAYDYIEYPLHYKVNPNMTEFRKLINSPRSALVITLIYSPRSALVLTLIDSPRLTLVLMVSNSPRSALVLITSRIHQICMSSL